MDTGAFDQLHNRVVVLLNETLLLGTVGGLNYSKV